MLDHAEPATAVEMPQVRTVMRSSLCPESFPVQVGTPPPSGLGRSRAIARRPVLAHKGQSLVAERIHT
jgi:hypothetical protein